jgi:RHS repeat-associated protein
MHDSILAGNIWQERGTYDVRLNPTLTGSVTYADITHASSIVGGGGSQTLGRGVLSSEGVQNRLGYAGYRYDHHLAGAGRHLYHVRHRVYQAHIGRWATRDPLAYVDGMGLYEYVRSMPLVSIDSDGLTYQPIRGIPADWIDPGPIPPRYYPPEFWLIDPAPPTYIPGCPLIMPNPATTGDGWCYSGPSDEHCGLRCFRSVPNGTDGGQQCCYDASGILNTDPDCAGTIDRWAPSVESPTGDCEKGRGFKKHASEYIAWRLNKQRYNEIQCCLRERGVPSGTPGPCTDDKTHESTYSSCAEAVDAGETFCSSQKHPYRWRPVPDAPWDVYAGGQ